MTPTQEDYVKQHEDQLQNQSRKLERLEAHHNYETQRIDELNKKIEKMDKKIDEILKGFNELKLQSTKDDNNLELRLKAIEAELATQKYAVQDSRNRFTMIISVVTIFFTALTFIFNFVLR